MQNTQSVSLAELEVARLLLEAVIQLLAEEQKRELTQKMDKVQIGMSPAEKRRELG